MSRHRRDSHSRRLLIIKSFYQRFDVVKYAPTVLRELRMLQRALRKRFYVIAVAAALALVAGVVQFGLMASSASVVFQSADASFSPSPKATDKPAPAPEETWVPQAGATTPQTLPAPTPDTATPKDNPKTESLLPPSETQEKVLPPSPSPAPPPPPPPPKPSWVLPISNYEITTYYTNRNGVFHAGIDMAAPFGTRINAVGAGTVILANGGDYGGYGETVIIDHGNGFKTLYGHMSAVLVEQGEHVTAGDQIGKEGSTGNSTGPHLHFGVYGSDGGIDDGNSVNPVSWLAERGVKV